MNRWRNVRTGTGLLLATTLVACGGNQESQSETAPSQAAPAQAALPAAPVAPGDVVVENLQVAAALAPAPGSAERGAEVMTTRKLGNCVACHKVSALEEMAPFHGEIGPSLDGAGSRWQTGQLRALVVNAKSYFPQTVMPAYYKAEGFNRIREDVDGQPILTAQQVEDVVAFLKTLK